MNNEEAFQQLLPLVGDQGLEALQLLYSHAQSNTRPAVDKESPKSFISYKQYKFLVNLAVAGGSTLSEELKARHIEQGEKPWHIDREAGKLLIDEFIKLGYQEKLPTYRSKG